MKKLLFIFMRYLLFESAGFGSMQLNRDAVRLLFLEIVPVYIYSMRMIIHISMSR